MLKILLTKLIIFSWQNPGMHFQILKFFFFWVILGLVLETFGCKILNAFQETRHRIRAMKNRQKKIQNRTSRQFVMHVGSQ